MTEELRDKLQKTLGGSYAFERELGGGARGVRLLPRLALAATDSPQK